MPQFIALVLIIVVVKLLYDYFKSIPAKEKPVPRGDFIDISEKWINADQMPYKKNDIHGGHILLQHDFFNCYNEI